MNCASTEQLYALIQNQLPPGEDVSLLLHLSSGCRACQTRLDELEEGLAASEEFEPSTPPHWLVQRAITLFTWYTSRTRDEYLNRIPAFLVIDSFTQGTLMGFRSMRFTTRRMLFRAGEFDVDLFIDYDERARSIEIHGQVLPLWAALGTVSGADVKLLTDSTVTYRTKTNAFGEFMITGAREGVYDLELELENKVIDIIELNAVVQQH